ncbi:selenoprotein T isoform X1 [Tachypleus tridentatus]|uniref:selenoprotein T isoform X1 n=1 Tax=Tachypleus tridentatus TaxID=6853 RepID=UPI003FCFD2FB
MPTPPFYSWMMQNKMYACLMSFFLGNTIEGQLLSTGAFEISFNGVPVWSKLESGRIPSPPELFQIIDNHVLLKSPEVSGLNM